MTEQTRIALPSGRLHESVASYLNMDPLNTGRDYTRHFEPGWDEMFSGLAERVDDSLRSNPLQIKLVHPRTIPKLVAMDQYHLGFSGLDLIRNSNYEDQVRITERTGRDQVRIALAKATDYDEDRFDVDVIATELINVAKKWAFKMSEIDDFLVIHSHGHTEALVPEDANYALEIVETGTTLEKNGLEVVEVLFESETVALKPRF